ncbi:MAG: SGNH/GDSL hydrolase family protein, partial [Sciscionella sp.]
MRAARILAGALALGVTATLSVTLPAVAASNATEYVALGDSYSSGVGTGDYDPSSGGCKRSPHAYAALWNAEHKPGSFDFVACSGATTASVISSQLSALDAATDLVTITVGGNDAGFTSVMETCVIGSIGGSSACDSATTKAINYVHTTLPGKLDQVYAQIHAKAPAAHVVVLGYPRLYTLGGSCHIGIGDASRADVNNAADALDDQIAKEAANAGFDFVDVRAAFADHGICSSDWWLN